MSNREMIYKMRTEDKMSYSQIAKELGISKTTVIYHSKRLGTTGRLDLLTDEERKRRAYNSIKDLRQRRKEEAVAYKGGKCIVCGYSKCVWALEFHHKNKNYKEFSFSKYSNYSWIVLKEELDKCDLLCANCHREEHFKNRHVSPLSDKE